MLALYRAGRQADALERVRHCRATRSTSSVSSRATGSGSSRPRSSATTRRLSPGTERDDASDADVEIAKAILAGRLVPVLGLDGRADLAAAGGGLRIPERAAARPRARLSVRRDDERLRAALRRAPQPLRGGGRAPARAPVPRTLAPILREHGALHPLIVSGRYDLAIERAFEEAGEEVDVVTYVAAGPNRGKFWHRPPNEEPRPIDVPNTYATELSLERRTVLLKLHGAVDPFPEREWESFVITEDDYIDYLGRSDVAAAVPVALAARLRRSHFLFLGYEMVDWNLRLVMHRVWGDRPVAYRSWAVDPEPTPLERAFWRRFEVDVLAVEPDEYVGRLERRLEALA